MSLRNQLQNRAVRFGVIGASGIGNTHLNQLHHLAQHGFAEIIAVSDIDSTSAQNAVAKYNCQAYSNYQELLARSDIDMVSICVPSGLHADIAIDAARAGKHVVVEKPMDIQLQKAEAMIAVARQERVGLTVIMQNRFAPDIRRVHDALQNGLLGRPVMINAAVNWYRSQEYYDGSNWRGTWAMDGGGAVMNQGIHTVDLMLHFMGDWKSMNGYIATLAHERIEVEDVAISNIEFENGALGVFTSTTTAYPGFGVRIEVFGSHGSVVLVDNVITEWKTKDDSPPPAVSVEPLIEKTGINLHGVQLLDAIRSWQNGTDSFVPGEEGIRSLRFIHHLYERGKQKAASR